MFARRLTAALLLFSVAFCFLAPAQAQEATGEKGNVDWVNGVVLGYGYGTAKPGLTQAQARIGSIRAATVDAQRNLLETIKGVRIDSRTLVQDFIIQKDLISAKVSGLLKGANVVDKKTDILSDGSPLTTVTMSVCIAPGPGCRGALVDALDLSSVADERIPRKAFAPSSQDDAVKGKKLGYDASKPVTGLVLNLMDRPYKKEVRPVVAVKTDRGLVAVYSFESVETATLRRYGMVRYAETVQAAVQDKKAGDNPLVVPVLDVAEDNVLLVSQEDAAKIYETNRQGGKYLRQARVAISYR
ncbi:MAG: LPP20 family lipoprotein [Desulfovibrionaceae bacterium]